MDSIALAAYKMAKNGVPGPAGKDGKDGKNGQDGNNGLTPYIGENGNWFIGDTDTGVKAEASDGINITITDIVESTEDEGENVVTFSNGQKLTVKNGKTGGKGDKGDPYVLNTTDKEAIVEDVKKEFTNVYKYSGSVATFSDLPKGLLEGDAGVVYNVEETEINYAWTGSKWDPLGLTLNNISYDNLKDTPISNNYFLNEKGKYNFSETKKHRIGYFYGEYFEAFIEGYIKIAIGSGPEEYEGNAQLTTITQSSRYGNFTFSLGGHPESTGGDTSAVTYVYVESDTESTEDIAIEFKWYTVNQLDNRYIDLENIQKMIDNSKISYNNLTDKPFYKENIYDSFNITENLIEGETNIILIEEGATKLTVSGSTVKVTYSHMGKPSYFYGIMPSDDGFISTSINCGDYGELYIQQSRFESPIDFSVTTQLFVNAENIEFDAIKQSIVIEFYKEIPLDTEFISNKIWTLTQNMIDTSISEYDAEVSALIGEVE